MQEVTDIDKTVAFSPIKGQTDTPASIIARVYSALQAKGYDPINQLVGYIISGDPTYITSYGDARSLICRLEPGMRFWRKSLPTIFRTNVCL